MASLQVEGLGKAYRIYGSPLKRVVEGLSLGRYKGHHEFWALRDVSFELEPGAALGLCGANGAGKSTLLKILAGTTVPTSGRFRVAGKVASLLELGAGFHLDFTGRENILMNGVMMGFSRREMKRRIDEIIEFAELGEYIDEPVRTYSSGMGLRLGFSVAVTVDPDVLIIDEVFAVGDMYFQKKCIDRIYEFKRRNKTILFCSHSLYDVRQLCDQAIWLDRGHVAGIGDSVAVTNEYTAFQRSHIGETAEFLTDQFPTRAAETAGRDPRELPSIRDARIYRMGTDEEAYEIASGDSIELRIWWSNPRPDETPIQLGMGFLRQDTTTCAGMATHFDGVELRGSEGCAVLRIPEVKLLSGQFLVPVLLLDGEGVHKYQEYLLPENLIVRTATRDVGLFLMEHRWVLEDHPLPGSEPTPESSALRARGGER
ncbi:MAG: polysaccharide ABC transporter ATP-binding protein [Planctomycetota bacterium]|nr:polysaccharide ABC transporter ATP-binding protein [Planctomycetota bacterium]